jgi:hypothetical protein
MPKASHHQGKATGNRAFLDSFDWNAHPDWAVVCAFYTAVHLIEHLRALDGQHSRDHQDRLQYVQTDHRDIHSEYHALLNASKLARYEANEIFFRQFSNDDVTDLIIGKWLKAIEDYVESYLAERSAKVPAKPAPPKPPAKKK